MGFCSLASRSFISCPVARTSITPRRKRKQLSMSCKSNWTLWKRCCSSAQSSSASTSQMSTLSGSRIRSEVSSNESVQVDSLTGGVTTCQPCQNCPIVPACAMSAGGLFHRLSVAWSYRPTPCRSSPLPLVVSAAPAATPARLLQSRLQRHSSRGMAIRMFRAMYLQPCSTNVYSFLLARRGYSPSLLSLQPPSSFHRCRE